MEIVISEPRFEAVYIPFKDDGGAWLEYWPEGDASRALLAEATSERRIWTMLDVDGFTMLASGWHVVNRLGYYISRVPVPDGLHVLVYDEEDWEEWSGATQ